MWFFERLDIDGMYNKMSILFNAAVTSMVTLMVFAK